MTVGFLTAQNLREKITANAIGPSQSFPSWINTSNCGYYEVAQEMEPDFGEFWGYCVELDVYFISQNVKNSIKSAILQMEDYRIEGTHSHAEAVAFAVSQPQKYRSLFIEALLRFYRAKQHALEDSKDEDIDATVELLKSCSK
jgi:hypothetical protein